MTEDEARAHRVRCFRPIRGLTDDDDTPSHDARGRRQSVRAGAAGPLRGRRQDATGPGRRRSRRCSRRGSVRSRRRRAASSRRWRSAAGRWRPTLICDACGVARERQSLVAMLRASHFIRSSGSSERVETYHDRIREVLAAQIAPDAVRRIHGRHGAGARRAGKRRLRGAVRALSGRRRHENASIQAGLAAAKAGAALAFDRPRLSTSTRWR